MQEYNACKQHSSCKPAGELLTCAPEQALARLDITHKAEALQVARQVERRNKKAYGAEKEGSWQGTTASRGQMHLTWSSLRSQMVMPTAAVNLTAPFCWLSHANCGNRSVFPLQT